ncbi:MAG: DUF1552 domain-containing protein [bacterium]
MKRLQLNRRAFIGGAGAALALPLLESMAPFGASAFAQDARPTRMIGYYVPCGIHMPAWTPSTEGANFQLSPTLAPLANVKDDILVLTGLANMPARPDGPGDHAAGTGSFMTATHVFKTEGADIMNGVSVDQVAAQANGAATRYPSLELGMDGGGTTGNCDSGYSCAYARNISWAGPQTPLPKTVDPRAVFDRLFAGFDPTATAEQQRKRRAYNTSILDYVLEDSAKLKTKLGSRDQQKIEEYMEGIRRLETTIAGMDDATLCGVPDRPGTSYAVTEKAQVMADLMVLAMQCDLTRIQTFMLANAGSGRVYDFLGIAEGHHELSHHQGLQYNYDRLMQINRWEIEQFAYLVEKLKAATDAEGKSLLDSCTVFFSSEISDGNRHNHDDMPIILAGKGNGAFTTGRHVRYNQRPVANLFISMLQANGVMVNSFGDDGDGPLENLS